VSISHCVLAHVYGNRSQRSSTRGDIAEA
jgi:hypothetical protein